MTLSARYYAWSLGRLERKLVRKRERLDALRERKDGKRISPATFSARKGAIDADMRELTARISTMKGALRVERHG